MRLRQCWSSLLLGACVVSALVEPASAQRIITGATALDNASLGEVALRAPGRMVTAGLARAIDRADSFRVRPQITETARPASITAQALPEAIDTFFGELNQFLFFIFNRLLEREGLPPLLPIDFLSDLSTDGDDADNGQPADQTGENERPGETDSTDRSDDRRPSRGGNR